ncbi:MAG: hypothetical protein COB67_02115 [SAR324 cluster bacterium]|uniref:DNA replication and repair protein RecF n=1 Tax=SAR324 cluster bacterium TaxID=2024889 RepID=A0A2A4T9S8_9DELT|nr:MAG: hypothetical protein COB67_02115 [SAR324 cluster bacterium]
MVIQSLALWNYRNYSQFEIDFHSGINFIYGRNGQGKTNLVEAIYFLTHLRSFRTAKIRNLYREKEVTASINAQLSKQGVVHTVQIGLQSNQKKVLINQKNLNYTSDYIKNYFSLLFAPDQLSAYKEYPLERRNFFDRVLILVVDQYFQRLKEFNRIKKQKNHLLRHQRGQEVFVWNQLLAEVVPQIVRSRTRLVEQVNENLSEIFQELTGRSDHLELCYRWDLEEKVGDDPEKLLDFLNGKLESEQSMGHMCYGPHKDDFWMTINGKKDKLFFSQGEYRISFLALQLALNRAITDSLQFCPVILLDDIFSELDTEVYHKTLEYISANHNQVFITSTSIPKKFQGLGKAFQIEQGRLVS